MMRRTAPQQSWILATALIAGGLMVSRQLPKVLGRDVEAASVRAARDQAAQASDRASQQSQQQQPYQRFEYPFLPAMTRDEALLVLGFSEGAVPSEAEVEKHFRALIAANHADVGGSPLLARKIIEAKAVLLP